MQIKKVIYPHRIPFKGYGKCDICSNPGKKIYSLPFSKYLGLVCCENIVCSNKLKLNIQKTTKTIDELQKIYGEKVKVKRNRGELEQDWQFLSYAYKEEENGNFWVYVNKDDNIKCITLENLNKWNS